MKRPTALQPPPTIVRDGLYTDEDVCALFGISLGTLRARLADGKLACHEDGHWRRFTGQQLLDYLAACQRPAAPPRVSPANPLRPVDAIGTSGCKVSTP
jgi:hypothetical protein